MLPHVRVHTVLVQLCRHRHSLTRVLEARSNAEVRVKVSQEALQGAHLHPFHAP